MNEIEKKVKGHSITHMIADGELPHNIYLLAPKLMHLRIKNVQSDPKLSE